MTHTIACVVGARPNFVKIGPVLAALRTQAPEIQPVLVHTGQHYDTAMSGCFFHQLRLPDPDVYLKVGSGRQGEQVAKILWKYEYWLVNARPRPEATLVVGDVNSTVACALASVKMGIPVIHLEAGLRSFDRSMPEEVNRVLTDAISHLLLVSEPSGRENLLHEGKQDSAIRCTGNVMIDVLRNQLPFAQRLNQAGKLGLPSGRFCLWTLHRPANVDDAPILNKFVVAMQDVARRLPVAFPVHPRTRDRLRALGLFEPLIRCPRVHVLEPLGYLECLSLSSCAKLIVTDSGGLQEEASALEVPCLVLRSNTERPITVAEGTSTLLGSDTRQLLEFVDEVCQGRYKHGRCPQLWDGKAGQRVAHAIKEFFAGAGISPLGRVGEEIAQAGYIATGAR